MGSAQCATEPFISRRWAGFPGPCRRPDPTMLHEPASLLKRTEPHFLNRELSLLAFNRRVLAQAEDRRMPMIERLRFLCIVSSNMDEFFEIRVAELKERINVNLSSAGPDGINPREVFATVNRIAHELVERQYRLLNEHILPELEKAGVRFLRRNDLNEAQRA